MSEYQDALIESLRQAGIPEYFILVLVNWYDKLSAVVRWNSAISQPFAVKLGVRQGRVLSPSMYNVIINVIIVNLKLLDVGCHVDGVSLGCLLYADDIILLAPSVQGLQIMLNLCYNTSLNLGLTFNPMKCYCISFGALHRNTIQPMFIGSHAIDWVSQITYLGVCVCAGRSIGFDIGVIKRTFFAACNSVYASAKYNDQLMHLSLQ